MNHRIGTQQGLVTNNPDEFRRVPGLNVLAY